MMVNKLCKRGIKYSTGRSWTDKLIQVSFKCFENHHGPRQYLHLLKCLFAYLSFSYWILLLLLLQQSHFPTGIINYLILSAERCRLSHRWQNSTFVIQMESMQVDNYMKPQLSIGTRLTSLLDVSRVKSKILIVVYQSGQKKNTGNTVQLLSTEG